jgi:hypothetical protein
MFLKLLNPRVVRKFKPDFATLKPKSYVKRFFGTSTITPIYGVNPHKLRYPHLFSFGEKVYIRTRDDVTKFSMKNPNDIIRNIGSMNDDIILHTMLSNPEFIREIEFI